MVHSWRVAVQSWMFPGILGAVHHPWPSPAHAIVAQEGLPVGEGRESRRGIIYSIKVTLCLALQNSLDSLVPRRPSPQLPTPTRPADSFV